MTRRISQISSYEHLQLHDEQFDRWQRAFFDEPELSTSTSWTSAFEFSSPLVLSHYLIDRLRFPPDRVELFARLAMIGA